MTALITNLRAVCNYLLVPTSFRPRFLGLISVSMLVIAVTTIGCSANSHDSTTEGASDSADVRTENPHLDASLFSLSVDQSDVDRDRALLASEVSTPALNHEDYVDVAQYGADVTFEDRSQPAHPLTLTFELDRDPTFKDIGGRVPAVIAISEGQELPEILRSEWNANDRILTATTTHLTTFVPALIDIDKALARAWNAAAGYLGQSYPKPDCVGESARIGATTYTLDPPSVPAAWPCLRSEGDSLAVDLFSNSPNGRVVQSVPDAASAEPRSEGSVAGVLDTSFYETVFSNAYGKDTYLSPGGTTTLNYAADNPPQRVTLGIDAGMTLLRTGVLGVQALYPQSKLSEIPALTSCVHTLWSQPQYQDDPTGAAFGALTKGLSDCVDEATTNLKPTNATSIANASTGALLSLIPDAIGTLLANIRGAMSPLTGESTQVLNVRTEQDNAPAGDGTALLNLETRLTGNGAGFPIGPNHFRISDTFKRDGRFYADTNYTWKINRPDGSDLGYCKGHVQIVDSSGQEIARWDDTDFNACHGGGGFSTNTRIFDPGTYTVNAQVEMQRGPTRTGSQTFVVDQ